ncbi:Protein kinase superfamily protein [Rhynchospora pubera]|uniref:Protein kinase superfamily protein n=1 Tax=Rhynchospora pubera TaxID=906938 RepID=A0AAV8GK89_9POAL|nr:Protein kinase superfamily protein [Rhynchospora pubera]
MTALLLFSLLLSFPFLSLAGDCPLEFTWANFTSAGPVCSDPSQRGNCCRYINAYVAIAVARYANSTGKLGVPPAFSDLCLTSVTQTFQLYGIPQSATESCGVGPKIRVTYQCDGRGTILEMMQSPGFTDVISNCQVPLSSEVGCKTCLNSGILYLHRLIGTDDNVALSVCRDAVFATLANQGDSLSSDDDMSSCFFGVGGLSIANGSSSEGTDKPTQPSSPNLVSAPAPTQKSIGLIANRQQTQHQAFHLSIIPGIGIGIILISVILLLILMSLIRRKSEELKNVKSSNDTLPWGAFPQSQIRRVQDGPSQMFKRYSYNETKIATNNFSTEIGKGGFGTVFKATFSDGSIAAVKRTDKVSKQGEEEFCREIELLARLHHRHLVTLKGFCVEGQERFLVYEYMANGSLKDHLHSSGQKALRWETRLQIAIDVANALEYLHFYCDPPLCHRDIKSSNILLDENFVAKVADFGLAHASRSGAISFEPVSTDIRGTPGYMDPEYVVSQELTEKSDIYSFGVLLLELVTGRRAIQDNRNLVEWAQKYMASEDMVPEMLDPTIRDRCDMDQLHMVVGVVRWCTQREGRTRPSIKLVLRVFSERLDPVYEDADEGTQVVRPGMQGKNPIPYSGDARCLQSSSSTTRSYCSRSVLLESGGSPQSPHTLLSL